MFIGREKELEFLEKQYNERNGNLVVLYGRKRIGKTETLKHFAKNKPHIFFSCSQKTNEILLEEFSSKLLKEATHLKNYIQTFSTWEKALLSILELPYKDKKRLVIIDEFPYLCNANPSIPSIIQNLWDTSLKDENIYVEVL